MKVKTIVILFVFCTMAISKNIHGAKTDEIRELITLTSDSNLVNQSILNIINKYKKGYPNVNQKFWVSCIADIKTDELREATIPIYDKLFTHKEIKALLKFFKSPLGIKMNSLNMTIAKETQAVARNWTKSISQKIKMKLEVHLKTQKPG